MDERRHRRDIVRDRFDQAAAAYAGSPVHARGEDLPLLPEAAGDPARDGLVVDVSAGAGHGGLALADRAARTVAVDLSERMLEQARRLAVDRGVAAYDAVAADVAHLPFPSGTADVVVNRIAAHHYPDLDAAVLEMARVLRRGGVLVAVDNVAPGPAAVDRFLHRFETARDPTHARVRSGTAWERALTLAGLDPEVVHAFRTRLQLRPWAERAGRTEEEVRELEAMLADAAPAVRDQLSVREDPWSFELPKRIWRATKR